MPDLAPLNRALVSVSDKTGLTDLGRALAERGVEILSTGGSAKALREAGIAVTDVSDMTGFPEMMDGRVKTLHPKVHGGLLALRDDPGHAAAMEEHGIGAIDLLVVNLYPFEAAVARGADYDEAVENIDIGGPAMIRAGAKNHDHVSVVVDVEDYEALLGELEANGGRTTRAFRQRLAQRAYARTAAYDAAVSTWMAEAIDEPAPRRRAVAGTLRQVMRYGENPHQAAAFYADGSARPGVATATQHQGKELSYNNINDTDAAFELVSEFGGGDPACVIVKHANPCGVARGQTLAEAHARAFDCDRTSAFGGIVALNRALDGETAEAIAKIFTEVVIAPGADAAAREVFASEEEPASLDHGRSRRSGRDGSHLAPGGGRLPGAGPRFGADRARRPDGGDEGQADSGPDRRPALRLDGGQAREVERHRLCPGRRDGGHRRGPDEPGGFHPDRGAQGPRHGRGAGPRHAADAGLRRRLGRVLSLRRRADGGRRGGSDGGDPARRIGPRRRGDRGRRRGGPRHGLHRAAAFPPLMRVLWQTAAAIFAIDQLIKLAVVQGLDLATRGVIEVAPPFLVLRMAWNRGVNFGLLAGDGAATKWVLVVIALAISAWVLAWLWRERPGRRAMISGGLLVGGALGNVVDRLIYGAVADFLNMSCCGIENPFSFNVADIAIFAGAVGLILFTGGDKRA